MPVRNETGGNQTPTRTRARASQAVDQKQDGDDVWDDIMTMKGKGDFEDGAFNKMNTNFWLKEGEEIDIVVLDDNPVIFWGHTIKCSTDKGQTFYRVEQCQKSTQDYCTLCESKSPAVKKSTKSIAFRILDSRGSWDKKLNDGKGGMNGIAVPKIFLVPLYVAKQFKVLKDDAGGKLSDKVVKLSKTGNYIANFKYKKNPDGSLRYVDAPVYDGELPEVLEVYAPMEDKDIQDFLHKFADGGAPQARNTPATGGRSSAGSFGD